MQYRLTLTREDDITTSVPLDEQVLKDVIAAAGIGLEGATDWIGAIRVADAQVLLHQLGETLHHKGNL